MHDANRTEEFSVTVGDICLLFGKAAVGKTAPGKRLEEKHGFVRGVSYELVIKSDKDGELQRLADAGHRWPDAIVNQHVLNHLATQMGRRHVLDGFCRSVEQAKALCGYVQCVDTRLTVIEIDAPDHVTALRVLERRKERSDLGLPLRKDDDPATHARRLKDYASYAPAVLRYFRSQKNVIVRYVDGEKSLEEVCRDVENIMLVTVTA